MTETPITPISALGPAREIGEIGEIGVSSAPSKSEQRAYLRATGWTKCGGWQHPDHQNQIYSLAAAYRTELSKSAATKNSDFSDDSDNPGGT